MSKKAIIINIEGDSDKIFRLNEFGIRVGRRIEVIKKDIVRIDGIKYVLKLNGIKIYLDDGTIMGVW